jgi:enamidase
MIGTRVRLLLIFAALGLAAAAAAARPQSPSDDPGNYISFDEPLFALTNVRVIDGTGAPAREGQTVVVRDGLITSVGGTDSTQPPAGAVTVDLTGRSLMPGLVMLHEHLFYPTSPSVYAHLDESFVRLYLAGGVTTMRTGGAFNAAMDIRFARAIDSESVVGPSIDVTAPYLNGPSESLQILPLADAADAKRQVGYWAEMGATSFKAYMNITRAELAAVIEEAHRRSLKVTGHLCSVTYAEAAGLGIDNLEHGFAAASDFVPNKRPDSCLGDEVVEGAVASLDPADARFGALVKTLVDRHVTLTSTLPVFETFVPGRPKGRGLDLLVPALRERVEATYAQVAQDSKTFYTKLFPKEMAFERAFVRAGGMLVSGTDPSGYGAVLPGFANARQLELLVEAGFTPVEAIQISTLNGARYLQRDTRIGSIAVGKQADLVVVRGDLSTTISTVENIETVFKKGVGYSPARLVDSVRGRVGLW